VRFHAPIQLGPSQYETSEGFLVCVGAAIARTGQQIYQAGEVPDDVVDNQGGAIFIDRPEAEVFREETIASINGKPFVNEHPEANGERIDVTPGNYKQFLVGIMLNGRRGQHEHDQDLLADIVVYDLDVIEAIRKGKRELSCGYDADFVKTGPNRGEQHNIVMNHLALVEKGRCGPRCAISDREEKPSMSNRKKTYLDFLRRAFKAKDEGALPEIAEEMDAKHSDDDPPAASAETTHIHLHTGKSGEGMESNVDNDTPPWFKEHQDITDKRFKDIEEKMGGIGTALQKWAKQEGGEEEHQDDDKRRDDDDDDRRRDDDDDDRRRDDDDDDDRRRDDDDDKRRDEEEGEEEEKEKEKAAKDDDKRRDKRRSFRSGRHDRRRDKSRDSAHLRDSFDETIAFATTLVPDIRVPVFDAKLRPAFTVDTLCKFRREALELANTTAPGRALINDYLGDRDKLADVLSDCGKTRDAFRAIAIAARAANSAKLHASASGSATYSNGQGAGGVTIAMLAQRMRDHYASK
jgi:hypothetical protein